MRFELGDLEELVDAGGWQVMSSRAFPSGIRGVVQAQRTHITRAMEGLLGEEGFGQVFTPQSSPVSL
jgi:hypothetical protein